jgi:hypothetical protein
VRLRAAGVSVTEDEILPGVGRAYVDDPFGNRVELIAAATRARLSFVVGASGVGKTSAVRCLEARAHERLRCFYFDAIGVPSSAVMDRDFGGPEAWQAHATRAWVDEMSKVASGSLALLDGQTRPSFVFAALADRDVDLNVVLLDCEREARERRVIERGQPELASPQMDSWAAYLRGQSDALLLPRIDTTELTVDGVADALERCLRISSAYDECSELMKLRTVEPNHEVPATSVGMLPVLVIHRDENFR